MKLIVFSILASSLLGQSLESCTSNPSSSECSNFKMDDATVNKALDSLCGKGAPVLVGCSIRQYCKADSKLNQAYCSPFSLLGDICKEDKKDDPNCKDYNSLCSPSSGSTNVGQCKSDPPMPDLISTSSVTSALSTICGHHEMPACDTKACPKDKKDGVYDCDQLTDLRNICISMDTMGECKGWNKMCESNSKFGPTCDTVDLPKKATSSSALSISSSLLLTGALSFLSLQ